MYEILTKITNWFMILKKYIAEHMLTNVQRGVKTSRVPSKCLHTILVWFNN